MRAKSCTVLGSSLLACTCRKMKPRPSPQPQSQNLLPSASTIQDWVILFTKQNITSNYSRPVFLFPPPSCRVFLSQFVNVKTRTKTQSINDIFQIMLTCLGSHEWRLNVTWCLMFPREAHLTGVGFPSGIS